MHIVAARSAHQAMRIAAAQSVLQDARTTVRARCPHERHELLVGHARDIWEQMVQQHRAHVGLQIHARQVERERSNPLSRGGPYARQRRQLLDARGKRAVIRTHDLLGGGLEGERTAVVPHALPRGEHLGSSRLGQREHTREPVEPLCPTRLHTRHLRLLQHHLGQPNLVRVVGAPPRKVAIQTNPFRSNQRTEGVHVHI